VERTRVTGRRCSSRAGGGAGEQQRGAQAGRGKPHATAAQEQAGAAQAAGGGAPLNHGGADRVCRCGKPATGQQSRAPSRQRRSRAATG